ncbi:hypothetical protein D3C81_1318500 [compost metagenome]
MLLQSFFLYAFGGFFVSLVKCAIVSFQPTIVDIQSGFHGAAGLVMPQRELLVTTITIHRKVHPRVRLSVLTGPPVEDQTAILVTLGVIENYAGHTTIIFALSAIDHCTGQPISIRQHQLLLSVWHHDIDALHIQFGEPCPGVRRLGGHHHQYHE